MLTVTKSMLIRAALLVLVTLLRVDGVFAQSQRGQIIGLVTDPAAASVVGAKVEVTSRDRGVTSETVSNQLGRYAVPLLPYGLYDVKVTAPGFAPYTATNVEILTSSTTTLDVKLSLAAAAAEITVQSSGVLLQADTSDVGTAVEEKLKSDVPNIVQGGKRTAASYVLMSPGVNPQGQLTIGGGRTLATETLMDGQTMNDVSSTMDSGALPSVESIGEYKLLLNSMPAEYGRSSGGMILYASKSGTNQLHGAAYEYLRNYELDARPWQAPTRNVRKQNEFGFVSGGPVYLPGLYNGHNKTFFWANFTGYTLRTAAATSVLTLPTVAMRQGDFSAPDLNKIYDPTALYTDASGNTQRQQFQYGGRLNVIDPARISAVSKYFLSKLPMPNLPGDFNNFVGSANATTNSWDFSNKMDHYFSTNSRLSGFYQWTHPINNNGSFLGDFFGSQSFSTEQRVRLDWTYTISPRTVHQAMYGLTRLTSSTQSNSYGQNVGVSAGLKGTSDPNCPEIWIDYPYGFSICGGHPADTSANLIQTYNDSLMLYRGTHSIKMGIQLIRFNENSNSRGGPYQADSAGSYEFTDGGTASATGQGGYVWSSFLLGYPSGVNTAAPLVLGLRQTYFAAYVQDDWKVSRKLTLNLGVRWDLNIPYSEVHGQIASFNPNLPNPGATGEQGALIYYGSGPGQVGTNRPGYIQWGNFAPRVGLAYQFAPKTVFRAFAGIVAQGIQNANGQFADRSGFQSSGSPLPNVNPYGLYYSWDGVYPQNVLGTVPLTDPAFRNGQSFAYDDRTGVGQATKLMMWSGGFERELRFGILADATYLYNGLRHGVDKMPLDQLPPQYWGLGQLLLQPLNSPQVQAAGFGSPFPQFDANLPLYRALLPYPQYTGVTNNAAPYTTGSYNAAIFKAEKRFSSGLTFLASYTISKNISDTTWASGYYGASPRDNYDRSLNKALQRFDTPQALVLSYSYELPFGSGKPFLAGSPRVVQLLVRGWTVSGVHRYQSGVPLAVAGSLSQGIPTIGTFANRVAGVPVRSKIACNDMKFGDPARNFIWNAAQPSQVTPGRPLAYQPEGAFQLGNAPTIDPQARQCGTANEDIGFNKAFYATERIRLVLGGELFNILNRHTWSVNTFGTSSVTDAAFGLITPFQINGPRQVQIKLRVEW